MARYDVYRNTGTHRENTPYLIDVQSDHLSGLATRIVIPLRLTSTFPKAVLPTDLTPILQIEERECFLDTPKLAAIPNKELKKSIGSAAIHKDAIRDALDRLYGAY
ncbi:MAG: CcdB family protein [Sinobacteraceae bacterium]|nr:CcdB family protein [Nevskiaceae bacterium]